MNLKRIIEEEMNDFDWAEEIPDNPLDGIRFQFDKGLDTIYTLVDDGVIVKITWDGGWIGDDDYTTVNRAEAERNLHSGQWITV